MRTIDAISIETINYLPTPEQLPLELDQQPQEPDPITLRDYQEELLDRLYRAWESHPRIMVQLPTGGGKTICLAAVIKKAIAQNQRVLLLVHREELLTQSLAKIEAVAGVNAGIIKCGYKPTTGAPVQVASIASLINRLDLYPDFDLIIVDEAHHSSSTSYQKIINTYPQAKLLGVTATPCRLDGRGFKGSFDELICGISPAALIEAGHLSQYKYFAPADGLNLAGLKVKRGEYTQASIAASNSPEEVAAHCYRAYQDYLQGKQVLIFASSVGHSLEISIAFSAQGIPAAHLDGRDDPALRAATMQAFRTGQIKVLTNCALFTEGLDVPGIDAVILARPTKSLSLFLQMVGRTLRPAPGKEIALIVDLGGNWERHGLPCDDRDWTLEGATRKPRELKRSEDGEVVEVVEKVVEPEELTIDIGSSELELREIHKPLKKGDPGYWEQTLNTLLTTQKAKNYKPGWLTYQLKNLNPPLEVWEAAAKHLNYQRGWAWHKWKEGQEEAIA